MKSILDKMSTARIDRGMPVQYGRAVQEQMGALPRYGQDDLGVSVHDQQLPRDFLHHMPPDGKPFQMAQRLQVSNVAPVAGTIQDLCEIQMLPVEYGVVHYFAAIGFEEIDSVAFPGQTEYRNMNPHTTFGKLTWFPVVNGSPEIQGNNPADGLVAGFTGFGSLEEYSTETNAQPIVVHPGKTVAIRVRSINPNFGVNYPPDGYDAFIEFRISGYRVQINQPLR